MTRKNTSVAEFGNSWERTLGLKEICGHQSHCGSTASAMPRFNEIQCPVFHLHPGISEISYPEKEGRQEKTLTFNPEIFAFIWERMSTSRGNQIKF